MRALLLATFIAPLAALGCRGSVRAERTAFDHDRVVQAQFLGVRGDNDLVWLERITPRGARIQNVSIRNGSATTIAATDHADENWVFAMSKRLGWRTVPAVGTQRVPSATFRIDDDVELHITRPDTIAVYGAADVRAVMGDDHVSLTELIFVDEPRVGPVYLVENRAVLVVRDGAIQSLRALDLVEARGALDNLAAIRRLRANDPIGAAVLLERAVARDPASGESVYNLACVHAILGDLDRAEAELAIAIAQDRRRFSRLARRDGDLAVLRERPSVQRLIGD